MSTIPDSPSSPHLEAERRLQAIFENAHDAILIADDEARYVDVNPAACALLGRTREDLIGKSVFDVTPPEQREGARALWRAFLEDGHQAFDYELERPDGTRAYVEYRAQVRILPGMHMSVMRDVTAQRNALAAVEESDRRFRTLFDSLPDGIVTCDAEGRIRDFNPAFQAMLGYTAEELRQLTFPDITPARWLVAEQRDVLRHMLAREQAWHFVKEYRRKDGSVVPVEVHSFIKYERERAAELWAVVRDLSRRTPAEGAPEGGPATQREGE